MHQEKDRLAVLKTVGLATSQSLIGSMADETTTTCS